MPRAAADRCVAWKAAGDGKLQGLPVVSTDHCHVPVSFVSVPFFL